MIHNTPLKERARGRWHGILPSLGISSSYLTGKHMACPLCREGDDRFRFDNKNENGTWICSRCGAGDGIKLVMEANGWDFKTAAQEIEKHIGTVEYRPSKPGRTPEQNRRDMKAVWEQTSPIQPDDPAARHLRARTGITVFPSCLRSAARLRYYDEDTGASYHPGMVALIVGPDGKAVNLHRTYLTTTGAKATVAEPRRAMPGDLPKGSAIRLARHHSVLGIAEGIETALSATALFDVPCWAVINTTLMAKWVLPSDVRELVIFGDHDANFAGHAAAYELAHRVKKTSLPVSVRFPPVADTDWNDVHQQKSLAA